MLKRIRTQNLSRVKASQSVTSTINSVSAHNFGKVPLLRIYIAIHKFDIICISETFLNSDTAFDDDNLKIKGYNIVRSDHPSNSNIKYQISSRMYRFPGINLR